MKKMEHLLRRIRLSIDEYLDEPGNLLTSKVIDDAIFKALSYRVEYKALYEKMKEQDINMIRKEIEYSYPVHHMSAETIKDKYDDSNMWYSNSKKSIDDNSTFWGRYKRLLIEEKGYSLLAVNELGVKVLFDIMNNIGNPNQSIPFLRRGLVIGDVQSGKTSTYIGLISKAADAGYKVIILLTGTIESLRRQTQARVEEGFIGFNIVAQDKDNKKIGVGNYYGAGVPVSVMTDRNSDFIGNRDRNLLSLENNVSLFIIKKNATVLSRLKNWLNDIGTDRQGKIPYPVLIVDDEADNASINTKKDGDPTKINKLIRELCNIFEKTSYVGFTATPYANIFIALDSEDQMELEDLFPANFITCLYPPDTYIGAKKIFLNNSEYKSSLQEIWDAGYEEEDGFSFYHTHKKEWQGELPNSLNDALYAFLLANAIRDFRGDKNTPRTMMINISRYIPVQKYAKEVVSKSFEEIATAIRFNISNIKNPYIQALKRVWKEQYKDKVKELWEEVSLVLEKSIEDMTIVVVNSSKQSEKLNYDTNKSLRVIAIGGLALSRGLTLEGLMVSYFYRNTATYDVLMQMGRWFGYRKGYEDLCRIWIGENSVKWYKEIIEATEELKEDIKEMKSAQQTPRNFGLRVRDDCDELLITARNKMRNAIAVQEISYDGRITETPYLLKNQKINQDNFNAIKLFIDEIERLGFILECNDCRGMHYMIKKLPKKHVVKLLNELEFSPYNRYYNKKNFLTFLDATLPILDEWDVVFMEGDKKNAPIKLNQKYDITLVERAIYHQEERLDIGRRGKIGGTSDGLQGLSLSKEDEEKIEFAKKRFGEEYTLRKGVPYKNDKFDSNMWFKYISDRRPLLIIYLIIDNLEHYNEPLVGIALGIPKIDNYMSYNKRYKANEVYRQQEQKRYDLITDDEGDKE